MHLHLWIRAVRESGLDPSAKHCLYELATYAREDGTAYPSYDTLARGIGKAETTVKRYLQAAREHGLLTWKPNGGPLVGRVRPNLYRLVRDHPSLNDSDHPSNVVETLKAPGFEGSGERERDHPSNAKCDLQGNGRWRTPTGWRQKVLRLLRRQQGDPAHQHTKR